MHSDATGESTTNHGDAAPSRREVLSGAGALAAGMTLGACGGESSRIALPADPERDPRLDELFSVLEDQRPKFAPIQASERVDRRKRLGRLLAERGVDALLMEGGATMTYLTGISWGHSERLFALVVTADGAHFWICPAFEEGKARLKIDAQDGPGGEFVSWQEHEYPYAPLLAALRERRARTLAIEPAFRYGFAERLVASTPQDRSAGATLGGAASGDRPDRVLSGQDVVVALRGRKDAHEIQLLRAANELTQLAIRTVARHLKPGLNGDDIAAMMDRAHRKLGLTNPWALCLIGPAAAFPHGEQHDIRLKPGDVLLIDTGGSFHGYQSDNTRTWSFDARPSEEVTRVWSVVRDAQQRAFDALAPGRACKEIDGIARQCIDAAGYGPGYRTFTHRLGHGIGLEGHEDPYFDGGNEVALESGMTLSNEPGIYLLDRFGVRLEDIVVITDTGADHFGTWQRSPESPA